MAKNIILCADGTWNGPDIDDDKDGVPDVTNVLKLFIHLQGVDSLDTYRLADEQERLLCDQAGKLLQVAKYIHGVGDSRNPISRLVGGGVGVGVVERIVRGYTFLSRYYKDGDAIYLVGFSRGAYTARALGGLVAEMGLMDPSDYDPDNKEESYRLAQNVWEQYRRASLGRTPGFWESLAAKWQEWSIVSGADNTDRLPRLRPHVPIKAVAVWDTVGAMGIPHYHKAARIDAFKFTDCKLSDKVEFGFHAVSIDERREDFTPTLWEPRKGVEQVLFAGAHADVGGGYPRADGESGLSDIALEWMCEKLASVGVLLNPPQGQIHPDPLGVAHEPWTEPVFRLRPVGPRKFDAAMRKVVHPTVLERMNASDYDPEALRG